MSEQEKPKSSFMQEKPTPSGPRAEVIDPLLYAGAQSVEDGASEWGGDGREVRWRPSRPRCWKATATVWQPGGVKPLSQRGPDIHKGDINQRLKYTSRPGG